MMANTSVKVVALGGQIAEYQCVGALGGFRGGIVGTGVPKPGLAVALDSAVAVWFNATAVFMAWVSSVYICGPIMTYAASKNTTVARAKATVKIPHRMRCFGFAAMTASS